jgi:hypothetical protein
VGAAGLRAHVARTHAAPAEPAKPPATPALFSQPTRAHTFSSFPSTHPPTQTKQDKKTEIYKRIVEETAEARPGVLELMDEALARPDVALCICSAATKAGFEKARVFAPLACVFGGLV